MTPARWIGVFLLGTLFGYGVANYQLSTRWQGNAEIQRPLNQITISSLTSTQTSRPKQKISTFTDAIVLVEFGEQEDFEIKPTAGIVVEPDHTLILPLHAVKHAKSGQVIDFRSHRHTLNQIISDNIDYDIVAVKSELTSGPLLKINTSEGELYLGREFTAVAVNDKTVGWVDSSPFQKPNGSMAYLVRLERPMLWRHGAMVDTETNALLGIAMTATNDPAVYEVIEATAVAALIESISSKTPLGLTEYSDYYFNNIPDGILERIQLLVNKEQWQDAVQLSNELLVFDWQYRERIAPHLDIAYVALANAAISENRYGDVAVLLDDADQKVGESGQRLILRAELAEIQGDFNSARNFLHESLELDPDMSESITQRIRRLVITENNERGQIISTDEMIDLLEEEITTDPNYAVYYHQLGKLYFNQGSYSNAIINLSHAIELDESFEFELTSLINIAKERVSTPGLTEVPLFTNGSTYSVNARFNEFPRLFRIMFDTGASFTAITTRVADILDISARDTSSMIRLHTANGIIEARLVNIESIELNGAVVRNVDVVILDSLDNYDGLLGMSFMNHFDIDINQTEKKLMLIRK